MCVTIFLWTVPGYSELVVFYFLFLYKYLKSATANCNMNALSIMNVDALMYCLCGYMLYCMCPLPSLVVFKTKVSTHLYQRLCPHLAGPKDQRSSIVENQPPVVCAAVSISFFVNLSN